jgi:hypothetical protein
VRLAAIALGLILVGAAPQANLSVTVTAGVVTRAQFVGAFYRPSGSPPFGIFTSNSPNVMPSPYPTPGSVYTGTNGYCDHVETNGYAIDTGYPTDPTKLSDIATMGVKFSRMSLSSFYMDLTHINGSYVWAILDSAECNSYIKNGITPILGIENGPVQYDSNPPNFSPAQQVDYASASDFGAYCGAIAAHEKAAFPNVTKYSIPGNEINDNPTPSNFPGGNSQIVSYTEACYSAIKAANPSAYVYGFELNMDGSLNVPGFISTMLAAGCGPGTCYDGLSMHLSLVYPIPSASTPCYPNSGGEYSMHCVTDVIAATGNTNTHVLIGETVYPVPADVSTEQLKATATVAAYTAFAANPLVDGVVYANVDECALYTSGYFEGGCLIDTSNTQLPAYAALKSMALQYFQ